MKRNDVAGHVPTFLPVLLRRRNANPFSILPMKFTPTKPPLTGETLDTLTARLVERGEPAFRAKQILEWLYKKRVRSWDQMSNLSKPLRAWLDETFDLLPACLV